MYESFLRVIQRLISRDAHTSAAQRTSSVTFTCDLLKSGCGQSTTDPELAGTHIPLIIFLQGAIVSPSMHLCFPGHNMRCTLFCARACFHSSGESLFRSCNHSVGVHYYSLLQSSTVRAPSSPAFAGCRECPDGFNIDLV